MSHRPTATPAASPRVMPPMSSTSRGGYSGADSLRASVVRVDENELKVLARLGEIDENELKVLVKLGENDAVGDIVGERMSPDESDTVVGSRVSESALPQ